MTTIARLEPFRGFSTLHDQVNRLFNDSLSAIKAMSRL